MGVFGFLLFNLIALHLYLNANGLTTYQFLQMRKKQEEQEKKEREEREVTTNKVANNQVIPAGGQLRGSMQSEESFSNLKKIMVSRTMEVEPQEGPID